MSVATESSRSPWAWVPTLYFGEGLPYVSVMVLSVVCYKNLGVPNSAIALYTSWLYLPWVIKPLWSPVVDLLGTKRRWVVLMQAVLQRPAPPACHPQPTRSVDRCAIDRWA